MASRNTELRDSRNTHTPSESLRELRLESSRTTPLTSRASSAQSCVDLMDTDSPRGTKSFPSPAKDQFDSENRDPGFRTPNLCSRPSFRDKFRSRPSLIQRIGIPDLELQICVQDQASEISSDLG